MHCYARIIETSGVASTAVKLTGCDSARTFISVSWADAGAYLRLLQEDAKIVYPLCFNAHRLLGANIYVTRARHLFPFAMQCLFVLMYSLDVHSAPSPVVLS